MSEIYTLDNVILNKDLNNLYNSLINNPVWNLSRSSLNNVIGTFPGFVVKDNDSVLNPGWHGYFMALFENINCNFYKKYKFTLPEKIKRIHLGAKNDSSFTEFHCDTNNSNSYTVVGFLTPQWDLNWGGSLFIEDKKFEFEPGKFIIFKSNLRHNGVGLNKTIPFWRITLNLVIEE